MKKNRKEYVIFLLLMFIIVLGGTYAYWTWNSSENKNIVFGTAGIDEYIIYDEGDSYFVGDFQAYSSFCESVHTTISISKTDDAANIDLRATIKMDINEIGDNIKASDNVYYVVTSGDSNISCNGGLSSSNVIASGTFKGVNADTTINLVTREVTVTEQKYTIWIWIDSSGNDISSLSLEVLDTNVWTKVEMVDRSSVNSSLVANPVVPDGMVPVTISNNGTVKTISNNNINWYNYSEKKWANAILVSESSRNKYLNTTDIVVNTSDILAYYVWIPRFKYKIWTTSVSSTGSEQTIDIVFEKKSTPKSNGTILDSYLTHPAFTFGGRELDGFWVGKFETTGSTSTPTVLPNVLSLTDQSVSSHFQTSLKFSGGVLSNGNVTFAGSNIYGLTNKTDSHMMKNSEWGAVAYLSHSIYGINSNVRLNNNGNYMTGCGALSANGGISTSCEISYGGAVEYPQSTTGNVTGIFDMSGGVSEYVMGVLADGNGNPISGPSIYLNSGFNGILSDGASYTAGISFPSAKYYDVYSITSSSNCTLAVCGGHALYETAGWYSDNSQFVNSSSPWFTRGGTVNIEHGGLFDFLTLDGDQDQGFSFRSVLVSSATQDKIIN